MKERDIEKELREAKDYALDRLDFYANEAQSAAARYWARVADSLEIALRHIKDGGY